MSVCGVTVKRSSTWWGLMIWRRAAVTVISPLAESARQRRSAKQLDSYPLILNFLISNHCYLYLVSDSDSDLFCFVVIVWLCRWVPSSGHPHYRVLPGLRLQHSLLPKALGSEPGTCPWVRWFETCTSTTTPLPKYQNKNFLKNVIIYLLLPYFIHSNSTQA